MVVPSSRHRANKRMWDLKHKEEEVIAKKEKSGEKEEKPKEDPQEWFTKFKKDTEKEEEK